MQGRRHTSLVQPLLNMYGLTAFVIGAGICVPSTTGASPPLFRSTTIPILSTPAQQANRDETSDVDVIAGLSAVSAESDEPQQAKRPRTHILPVHRSLGLEEGEDPPRHSARLSLPPIERLGRAYYNPPQGSYHPVGPTTAVVTPTQSAKLVPATLGRRRIDASAPHRSTSTTISISANRDKSDTTGSSRRVSTGIGEPHSEHLCTHNNARLPELEDVEESRPTTSTQREGVIIMQHTGPVERQGGPAAQWSCHPAGPGVAHVRPVPPQPGHYPVWKFVIDQISAGVQFVRWEDEANLIFKVYDTEAFAVAFKPFSRRWYYKPSMPFVIVARHFAKLRSDLAGGVMLNTPGKLVYRIARLPEIVNYLNSRRPRHHP